MVPKSETYAHHLRAQQASKNDQIDYLLVSDALFARLNQVQIERRGIWASAKKTRDKFPPLATVTGDTNAASDHAAVWAEFDLP